MLMTLTLPNCGVHVKKSTAKKVCSTKLCILWHLPDILDLTKRILMQAENPRQALKQSSLTELPSNRIPLSSKWSTKENKVFVVLETYTHSTAAAAATSLGISDDSSGAVVSSHHSLRKCSRSKSFPSLADAKCAACLWHYNKQKMNSTRQKLLQLYCYKVGKRQLIVS